MRHILPRLLFVLLAFGGGLQALAQVSINNFGSIAPGDSLVIYREVKINTTGLPAGFNHIASRGFITATGMITVLTDDPTTVPADSTITVVNMPPVIAGTVSGQTVNDNATINPFSGVTISDVNTGQSLTVTITFSNVFAGVFTPASLGASGFLFMSPGVYQKFSTTPAAATSAIQALVYDPADNQVAPGMTVTNVFTINVDDGFDMGQNSNTSVNATSANDAPVFSNSNVTNTICDNIAPGLDLSALLRASDPDVSQNLTWTVVSGPLHGSLLGFPGGPVVTPVTGGVPSGLYYTPTNGYSGTDQFTIQVSDGVAPTQRVINVIVEGPVANNAILSGPQTVCSAVPPAMIDGSTASGGNGTKTYLWESSTTNATTNFGPAAGTNNTEDYSPGTLSQTTWFRRRVTVGGACYGSIPNTTAAVQITVSNGTMTITAPPGFAVNATAGQCYAGGPSLGTPTATNNCGTVTYSNDGPASGIYPVGLTVVTWTGTDAAMNTATDTQEIHVVDNQGPVISGCPTTITVQTGPGNTTCTQTAGWTPPTATDNCGMPSVSSNYSPGASFPVGTTQVKYIFTDVNGNKDSCLFNVVVQDNTPPVISGCPTNITLTADPANCMAIASWTPPTATDNCGGSVGVSNNHNPGESFPVATTQVTYTFTQGTNQSQCTFNVIVQTPEISVTGKGTDIPDGKILHNFADGTEYGSTGAGSPITDTFAIHNTPGTVALTVSAITLASATPGSFTLGGITLPATIPVSDSVRFTVTFNPNTSGSLQATVHIASNDCNETDFDFSLHGTGSCSVPHLTGCPANQTGYAPANSCAAAVTYSTPSVTGVPAPTLSHKFTGATLDSSAGTGSGMVFNKGITLVKIYAQNACGKDSCVFNVTVLDTVKPIVTCPANIVRNTGTTTLADYPLLTDLTDISGHFGNVILQGTSTPPAPPTAGNPLCENGSYLSFPNGQNITTPDISTLNPASFEIDVDFRLAGYPGVNGTINFAPVIMGGNFWRWTGIVVSNTGQAGIRWNNSFWAYSGATTLNLNQWYSAVLSFTANRAKLYIDGALVLDTLTGALNANGDLDFMTTDFSTGRVHNGCVRNLRIFNVGNTCNADVYYKASATDNCSGTLNYQYMPASGSTFSKGTTPVSVTATDVAGNPGTCNFTVTVVDNLPPLLACPGNQVLSTLPNTCAASYTIPDPITDNCTGATWGYTLSGNTTATVTGIADGSGSGPVSFNKGVTTVTLSGTDGTNGAAPCSFTVTVNDNQPPVVSNCPGNITVYAPADSCAQFVSWTPPTATDNCGGTVDVVASHSPNAFFNVGVTNVSYTFTDGSGLSTPCNFTVTVRDTVKPVARCKANATVTLSGGTGTLTPTTLDSGSYDNCTFGLSLSKSSFTCADAGVQVVTLTATDASSNTATCQSNVTVNGAITAGPVTVTPAAGLYTGGVPTTLYLGYGAQSATLTGNASGGSGITYSWSPGGSLSCTACQSTVITPTAVGNYTRTVTATNGNGCSSSAPVTICVKDPRVPGSGGRTFYVCHSMTAAPGQNLLVTSSLVSQHLGFHPFDNLGLCGTSCSGPNLRGSEAAEIIETVKVYPNPSDGSFTVALPYISESTAILVTDLQGRKIVQRKVTADDGNLIRFNLNLAQGVYFVIVKDEVQDFRTRMFIR